MAVCRLHDRAVTDRKQQQVRERRVNPLAPYGVQQVGADVHDDPGPLQQHDSVREGCLAKTEGGPRSSHYRLKAQRDRDHAVLSVFPESIDD